MTRCLDTPDFLDFLSRLSVDMTITSESIIVHAIAGDMTWWWTGTMWCW
jgi:hypothetical protein